MMKPLPGHFAKKRSG